LVISRNGGIIDIFDYSPDAGRWHRRTSIDIDDQVLDLCVILGSNTVILAMSESATYSIVIEEASSRVESRRTLPGGPYTVARFGHAETFLPVASPPQRILVARDDACPVVIDQATMEVVWSGKNASNTPIGLASVFRTTCLLSIRESVFAACDESGKLRLYDTTVQRKPILEFPIFQVFSITNNYTGTSGMGQVRPIQALALSTDGQQLFLGDTYGSVIVLDLKKVLAGDKLVTPEAKIGTARHIEYCRKSIPMSYSLKGVMGSVRAIAVTERTAFVVSAGRFAYEFDLPSKGKKNAKLILKQKLTACLPVVAELPAPDSSLQPDETNSDNEEEAVEMSATDFLEKLDNDAGHELMSKSKRRRLRKGASKA
jgi:hypothetical protein